MIARCERARPARVDGVAVTERPAGDDLPKGFEVRETAA